MSAEILLASKTTLGKGAWVDVPAKFVVTCGLADTTTPTASVNVEWTPDKGTTIQVLGTFTMSGALDAAMAPFDVAPGRVRLDTTAISGTLAAVSGKVAF